MKSRFFVVNMTHFSLLEDDCSAVGFSLPSTADILALALMGLNWTCQLRTEHKNISCLCQHPYL